MRSDWQKVSKKLATMKRGEQEYFHTGKFEDPILLKKGDEPKGPTLLDPVVQTKPTAKVIMSKELQDSTDQPE